MTDYSRRALLTSLGSSAILFSLPGIAAVPVPRRLSFYHTHTRLSLDVFYHDGLDYIPESLEKISAFLRDFRTRDAHPIDPQLLDQLFELKLQTGSDGQFQVISGYRSPKTNQMLRQSTDGVAEGSLHMQGRAIDVRLTDIPTTGLHRAARDLARGGVGYYPRSDFIHLDTGSPRFW